MDRLMVLLLQAHATLVAAGLSPVEAMKTIHEYVEGLAYDQEAERRREALTLGSERRVRPEWY